MTNPAFIADLERLEDEIDEALLHCPNDDSQMFVELRRRQAHLKEQTNGSGMKCSGTEPCTKAP